MRERGTGRRDIKRESQWTEWYVINHILPYTGQGLMYIISLLHSAHVLASTTDSFNYISWNAFVTILNVLNDIILYSDISIAT